MIQILLALAVFIAAVVAFSLGAIIKGHKNTARPSCGGAVVIGPDGRPVAQCSCEDREAKACPAGEAETSEGGAR
jgi:hypothetical protein